MYLDNIRFREQDMFVRYANRMFDEITNLQKEVKELKEIVSREQENKELEEKPKDYELCLSIDKNSKSLTIGFYFEGELKGLGYITTNGYCFFLSASTQQEHWETWKQKGFKVAKQEPIEWQGLNWRIDVEKNLRIVDDMVYGFMNKRAYSCVTEDKNFLKKDSNNRIHLY